MTIQLFPFPGADGRQSNFVRSASNPEQVQVPDLLLYSSPTLRFKPVQQNPTGAFGARISAVDGTGMTAIAMAYTKAAGSAPVPLASTGIMSWSGGGYFEGLFDLNTAQAVTAIGSAAAGTPLDVRFVFILLNASTQPTVAEAGTRLFYTVPPDDLPDPTNVTETIFANLLELALTNSDTLKWRRTGNDLIGDVPLFGADAVLANLSASFTVAGVTPTPATGTDVETVGGLAGERYLFRVKVAGTYETAAYTSAANKPGDPATIARAATVPANQYDRWYLDISSPAQRIYLNHGANSAAQARDDYYLRFLADAGATVTLGFDTVDNQSTGSSNMAVTVIGATEVPGPHVLHRSSVAASAHTGNTTETTKATITVPPLGLHSQLRLGVTWSRPSGQADDAFLVARLGGTLLWRQRVGYLRGGTVEVPVLSNRNSQSSQVFAADTESDHVVGTGALNTAVATSLTVAVQLVNAADSLTLEAVTLTRENPT